MAVNIVWPSSNTIDACVRNGIEPFNFTASLQKLNTFPAQMDCTKDDKMDKNKD